MSSMTIYCGWWRETEVEQEVQDLGCGAGVTACIECGGDGDWGKFLDAPGTELCVECKGTGKILVSV